MIDNGHYRMEAGDATIVAKALIRASTWLGLSRQEVGAILGAEDASTYATVLESDEAASKQALLLIHLHALLTNIVGSDGNAAASWLRSHNIALEARPLELIQSSIGLERVVDYLVSRSGLGH